MLVASRDITWVQEGINFFMGWGDASESLKGELMQCCAKAQRLPLGRYVSRSSWDLPQHKQLVSGSKFLSSWWDGGHRSLAWGSHRGGSTLFTFEPLSVLLGKTRVRPDRGGVSKVKVSELVNQWHLCKDRLIVRCLTGERGRASFDPLLL